MKIIKALYHNSDVTESLKRLVVNDRIDMLIGNGYFGDPAPGVVKQLVVDYEDNEGNIFTASGKEGEQINIPETKCDRLGIFYTNNNKQETAKTIDFSLNRIKVASQDKADIITSVWHPLTSNPFPQYMSWMKEGGHLNQCLQILHLLYVGKKRKDYKYVSFLEHDVLYPEGYFDFPDFETGTIMTNMNYIGLRKEGWQGRRQNDEPLSQMTMTLVDAIDHFHTVFQNALVTNSGLLENQNLKRDQWHCDNPAVHVNHGFHFTSHYSIYSDDYKNVDDYWGNKDNYTYLFPEEEKQQELEVAAEPKPAFPNISPLPQKDPNVIDV